MFEVGVMAALKKVASMDQTVHEVIKPMLPAKASPTDDLETLLPEDGELETVVAEVEDNFGIILPSNVVFRLFAKGTVVDLEKAVVDQLVMKKTAATSSHAYYMQHRSQMQQKSRQYRMRNLHQIRRKSRIYRKKVKRRQIRPRRRVGTRGGGYTFIAR